MLSEKTNKIIFHAIIPLAIIISIFVLPLFKIMGDIDLFLTVSSLIFTILAGFFIATATTNYINFQHYLAKEAASLASIFNLVKIIKPTEKERVAEIIDRYAIATLDFSLAEYVDKTHLEFQNVIDGIDEIKPERDDGLDLVILGHLQGTKIELIKNRESIAISALRVTNILHWFVLGLIAFVLVFLLFSLRTEGIILNFVIGILSLGIYFILRLLYEIDGNTFLEEQIAYQDVQKIFRSINKLPYYPSFAINSGKVKKPQGNYRLGVYADYPHSRAKEIKEINVKT